MQACRTAIALTVAWVLLVASAHAQTQPADSMSMKVNARSAVLVEVATNTTLLQQDPDVIIEPASFTKILTLYLVFQGLRQGVIHLADPVWISERAWRTGGSRMFVEVNTQVPLEDLIKGFAVVSGNDACVAVAEHMYGSVEAFVAAMNTKAKELGMTHSKFMNPNGLPVDGQVTTAGDMAKLMSAYIRRFPEALRFHSMKEYTYNNITQRNRNRLLFRDSTVDGLKTGYVEAAGYHLAATAKRDNMRLLAVVMGTDKPRTREAEAAKLLNWGFRHFTLLEPVTEAKPLVTVAVWKGVEDYCQLHAREPIKIVAPSTEKDNVHVEVDAPKDVTAPIELGQELGSVKVLVGNEVKSTVPLVAASAIAQAGFLKRMWHSLVRIHSFNWKRLGFIALGALLVLLLVLIIFRRMGRRRTRRRI